MQPLHDHLGVDAPVDEVVAWPDGRHCLPAEHLLVGEGREVLAGAAGVHLENVGHVPEVECILNLIRMSFFLAMR